MNACSRSSDQDERDNSWYGPVRDDFIQDLGNFSRKGLRNSLAMHAERTSIIHGNLNIVVLIMYVKIPFPQQLTCLYVENSRRMGQISGHMIFNYTRYDLASGCQSFLDRQTR